MIDLTNFNPNPLPPEVQGLILWRYMSFQELESIFEKKAIEPTPALKFPDPFEGKIPKKQVNRWIKKIFSLPAEDEMIGWNEEMYVSCAKNNTYIKSFHVSETESKRMWDEYGSEGVAIKLNSNALGRPIFYRFKGSVHFDVVNVEYVDAITDDSPFIEPQTMYCFKIKHLYGHEKEVRIIGTDLNKSIDQHNQILLHYRQTGKWVNPFPVSEDIPKIPFEPLYEIDEVVLNTNAKSDLVLEVSSLLKKYRYSKVFRKSELK